MMFSSYIAIRFPRMRNLPLDITSSGSYKPRNWRADACATPTIQLVQKIGQATVAWR
jgi:hypothetical protein